MSGPDRPDLEPLPGAGFRRIPGGVAHPGDACPQGWTHLGGGNNTVACTSGKPGVVALLDETVDGDHYSTFDQEGEVCPEGWEYIGGGYGAVACHKAGNEGPPVYIDQDTDGVHYADLPHAREVCPEGWTHLGGGSSTQASQAPPRWAAV